MRGKPSVTDRSAVNRSSLSITKRAGYRDRLDLPNKLDCHHGLQQGCNECDTPIPYVLTTLYFEEREQKRLTEWHNTLRAEVEPRGSLAHLGREA